MTDNYPKPPRWARIALIGSEISYATVFVCIILAGLSSLAWLAVTYWRAL